MKKVLIIEDNPINLLVFRKILTKMAGLVVKHSEDVSEVIQITQSGEADIILMDVSLSNSYYQGKPVDGIKITQMLKANSQTAHLPVILVTAHTTEPEKLLEMSGADDYIPKPVVDYHQFVEQILAYRG
ncbi:MAG: response regulator [Symploca sp. SIO2D2]|nr:response regulator [Symploca sp. SIO2D2]